MTVFFLYKVLLILPCALTASSFLHVFISGDTVPAQWLAITAATSMYLLLLKFLKRGQKGILPGITLSAVLAVMIMIPPGERLNRIYDHRFILLEILVAAACFLTGYAASLSVRFRMITAAASLAALPFLLLYGKSMDRASVCILLFYVLVTIADLIQRHTAKEGDTSYDKHLVFISPFMILIFLIMLFIKVPSEPYDWQFVRSLSRKIQSGYVMLLEELFSADGWDSNAPVIGFSDRGGFGGDLTDTDYPVMELYPSAECDPRLYLSGRSFDTFNGRNWEKTDGSTMDEKGYDTLETLSAVMDASEGSELSDMMKPAQIRIEYKDIRTGFAFSTAKTAAAEGADLLPEGGDLRFSDRTKSKEPYRISYYRINRGDPAFEELLDKGHVITSAGWKRAQKQSGISMEGHEDYKKYRDMIYEIYGKKTALSPGLADYMEGITAESSSDYEKLLCIEKLLKGFSYTDKPGRLPESVKDEKSFLDYFILEKQAGYCSYFATSFVLLARAYGIPARYVQGFRVPAGRRSHIEVLSSSAHAWPEAYIDGVGWFVFEPTPGLVNTVSWNRPDAGEAKEAKEAENDMTLSENRPEDIREETDRELSSVRWYQFLIPPASGIALAGILFLLDGIIKKLRYRKMSIKEKGIWLCHRDMELLKKIKEGRGESETISEYRVRLSGRVPEDCLFFCETYEKLLYSEKGISGDELREAEEGYKRLLRYTRQVRRSRFLHGRSDETQGGKT